MKATNVFKGALAGLVLLLASGAFAVNKGSLELTSPVTVGGKQLSAGDYTVQWDGNGPNVQVSILKGKKVISTVPAKTIELEKSPNMDAAVVKSSGDGTRSLAQVRFGGKKYALQFESDEGGASDSGSGVR